MSMKKRIISFFLSLTLMVTSFILPSGATLVVPPVSGALAVPGGVALGTVGVVTAPALALGVGGLISFVSSVLEYSEEQVQAVLDVLVSEVGYGNVGKERLEARCNFLNQISANPLKYSDLLYQDGLELGYLGVDITDEMFVRIISQITAYQSDLNNWHIIYHQDYGYVIANASETFILADSIGRYPYYLENTDLWFTEADALKNTSLHVATQYMLDSLQAQQESLHPDYSIRQVTIRFSDGNRYKVIKRDAPGAVGSFILCDQLGFPYGLPEGNTQMGADRDYNNDKEEQPETSDEPIVDIDGDLVMQMFPDGSFTWINSVIYDASNKTYNIDASTSYNIENNTYYNFEWHYTYHIDYTSITYIGQTEEYNKQYEYYYNLPDGRSSADLTAEDLLALNVSVDVVPYIRSADDTSIRALYHFDGNTKDSSYWNYLGEFKWNKGASITYMDAGVFEGALYLDETEHDFTFKLPSNVYSSDFTLQFRYYQSYTATPQVDSYIQFDSYKLMQFSGSQFLTSSGSFLGTTSIGNWQEICIQRKNGETKWFLNGVPVGTGTGYSSVNFGNEIRFVFGASQQTYKYFDEFRFVNKAVYDTSGYTPSSVPFDTNLTLVLPGSTTPVADEYWIFNSTGNLLPVYDFSNFTATDFLLPRTDAIRQYPNKLIYNPNNISVSPGTGMVQITQKNADAVYYVLDRSLLGTGVYTFTIMLSDGTTYSHRVSQGFSPGTNTMFSDCFIGDGNYYSTSGYSYPYIVIRPPNNTTWDVVYMELVRGSTPNTGHEFVSAVAPVDSDFKTPTLAVRTDLDISGYQIGGVRPSLPEKGLVWAMVESGRINSLQIYNGQAWEQVDGRIWTGSRWVPYYAYDLLLLKDLYDIVESDPSLDYIYTEAGFWKWLQSAWGEMMKKLDAIIVALGGSAGTTTDETLPGGEDNPETEMDEGWKFIDLLAVLRDGMWSTVKGVVSVGVGGFTGLVDSVSNVGGFFSLYEPTNPDGILGIFVYEGEDVWA